MKKAKQTHCRYEETVCSWCQAESWYTIAGQFMPDGYKCGDSIPREICNKVNESMTENCAVIEDHCAVMDPINICVKHLEILLDEMKEKQNDN